MAQAEQAKKKSRRGLVWGLIVVLGLVLAGVLVLGLRSKNGLSGLLSPQAQTAPKTAPVTTITAVTSVTAAGPVSAVQSGEVVWKTSGTVTTVTVIRLS